METTSEFRDVPTGDGVADAYLARPDDGERHPGVLLLIDAFGLRSRIEEMADRIAERGYAVLAPNLFYRDGRAPVLPFPALDAADARAEFMQSVAPLIAELTPERIAADGDAYLAELATVAAGPVAIAGYCMGARLGWRIATARPERVAALAGFHGGGLATDAPDSPHRSAGALRDTTVYFGHADQDRSMTREQIAVLDAALEEARVDHRSEVYAGASHGYTMADTPMYDEQGCERHYAALFDLLARTSGR